MERIKVMFQKRHIVTCPNPRCAKELIYSADLKAGYNISCGTCGEQMIVKGEKIEISPDTISKKESEEKLKYMVSEKLLIDISLVCFVIKLMDEPPASETYTKQLRKIGRAHV